MEVDTVSSRGKKPVQWRLSIGTDMGHGFLNTGSETGKQLWVWTKTVVQGVGRRAEHGSGLDGEQLI